MGHQPLRPRSRRRAGAGIGLLLVLLSLLIILVLYFATSNGKSYTQSMVTAKKTAKLAVQEINTQQVTIMLAQYRQTNNKLPKSLDEVEDIPAQLRNDPWGKPLEISFETDRATGAEATRVTYKSAGPDGVPGTADDIAKIDVLPF